MGTPSEQVKRRRVFYIPGYDPMPPRRYRELYRAESQTQAEISGYEIDVKARATDATFGWITGAKIDEQTVLARVDVLVWSDIVRDSMAQSIPATYWQLLQTGWIYISTGTLRRLMWMRKGPVIAALYPVGMLLLQLVAALGIGAFVGNALQAGLIWLGAVTGGQVIAMALGWIGFVVKYLLWGAVSVFLLRWFKSKDNKLFAHYLMHDYAFSARGAGKMPEPLDTRMAQFGDMIAAAFQEDVDEVLVVGHSSGAHLAVTILADLIRAGRVPTDGPVLAFLSLGQVVPMVSFLPRAMRLRTDLAFLSTQENITWVDVTAPGDGCCFALCDPVAVTGVAPPGKRWPLVISAAFTQSLTPARWKALRWRFFRLHFQYLCAFDQPKDYDYFQITAGPLTLRARYQGRPPSKSRIDVVASKYTNVQPE
ncbi:hypothetical protein DS901_05175 [Loktanella sp. D2R18]|uniref:hypothetical protein n=1 Tax=Rhodobacterales TaxID=204455 RepID=UPI000DEA3FAC|nr:MULTISPECIES: hypothetical protein [Rhodobacterales]MDO6590748.1 hypothetical protein [Yoonia sp. 1_MG-2023]RBW44634.1 hypothetical protein DS901_05175 [Loktanella sp. D2R18]